MTVDNAPDGTGTTDLSLATSILLDAFARVAEQVPMVLADTEPADVLWQPGPATNSIGWLIWHLARVEDDHVAGVAGREQVWTAAGFADRFGLPYPTADIGYGQQPADVAAFSVGDAALLAEYYDAVHRVTAEVISTMAAGDFRRIVDERWDPPVTAAVRLVSVINDITAHVGQAAYLKGLLAAR